MTREEVYKGLEQADAYFRSSFDAMYGTVACEKFRSWVDAIEHALALLKEQEPVVRCSECKYAHMTYDGECKYCDFWQEDGGDALYLDKGFYCAAGERRDGESDG